MHSQFFGQDFSKRVVLEIKVLAVVQLSKLQLLLLPRRLTFMNFMFSIESLASNASAPIFSAVSIAIVTNSFNGVLVAA